MMIRTACHDMLLLLLQETMRADARVQPHSYTRRSFSLALLHLRPRRLSGTNCLAQPPPRHQASSTVLQTALRSCLPVPVPVPMHTCLLFWAPRVPSWVSAWRILRWQCGPGLPVRARYGVGLQTEK
jgi:hypothetical protein